jgi:acetoin utilization deacetylase AcuC-like enzyme
VLQVADQQRARKVLDHLFRERCLLGRDLRRPRAAGLADLLAVHDLNYLGRLDQPEVLEGIFGLYRSGLDTTSLIAQQRLMAGGTILAARLALRRSGARVVNLGGGFHHAFADRGQGFCVFNDVALAIAAIRRDGFGGRVLVVDLDLHPGNGTRSIFAADEEVFTFSLHAVDWDEEIEAVADRNVALGNAVGDEHFLEALARHLPDAVAEARPDLVMYLAGTDPAADDPLGSWRLSPEAILERDRAVLSAIADRPLVWLLAGGYGPDAWRYSARSLAWLCAGVDLPIPSTVEQQLDHYRRIAAQLRREDLIGAPRGAPDQLAIDDSDVLQDLGESPRAKRFLNFYSALGVEVGLERYGVTQVLREAGYEDIRVDMDLEHSTGQRLRVVSDDPHEHLLMEVVVRDFRSRPPWRLLYVDWLLLQDPRGQPDRPLLPGQEHPGLGCLREVVGMLLMVCERLGFDGLALNPAHLHVAAVSKGFASFLDPEHQARFLALEAATESLPLAEASLAVEGGRVVNTVDGQVLRWQPATMVVPVAATLSAQLSDKAYGRAVENAAAKFKLRLLPSEC